MSPQMPNVSAKLFSIRITQKEALCAQDTQKQLKETHLFYSV